MQLRFLKLYNKVPMMFNPFLCDQDVDDILAYKDNKPAAAAAPKRGCF